MSEIKLYNQDCFEFLKNYSGDKFDLVLTDPPYGNMKGLRDNLEWDDKMDFQEIFNLLNNVTRKNSKVLLFCQEPLTSQLITTYQTFFKFNYKLIWKKNNCGNAFNAKKAHLNYYEEILVFTKKFDTDFMKELRDYALLIRNYLQTKNFNKNTSYEYRKKLAHFYAAESVQFSLCSKEAYDYLIEKYNIDLLPFYKTYEELVELKKSLTFYPTFNLQENEKFKSNVLEYKKPNVYLHPTQKPVDLLEDLIKTFTNENDSVLDFTMGSGSTGVACKNTNRNFTGVELKEEYFKIAQERIK